MHLIVAGKMSSPVAHQGMFHFAQMKTFVCFRAASPFAKLQQVLRINELSSTNTCRAAMFLFPSTSERFESNCLAA